MNLSRFFICEFEFSRRDHHLSVMKLQSGPFNVKLFVGIRHRKGISYGQRKYKRRDRTALGHDSFFNLSMGTKWASDFLICLMKLDFLKKY